MREQAAAFMQVAVGMTAAESVEYYPPLPHDRSVDHYRLMSGQSNEPFFCLPEAGTVRTHYYCLPEAQSLEIPPGLSSVEASMAFPNPIGMRSGS